MLKFKRNNNSKKRAPLKEATLLRSLAPAGPITQFKMRAEGLLSYNGAGVLVNCLSIGS
jgi:hypothetical protein